MAVRAFRGVSPTLGERVYIAPEATIIGDVTLGNDSAVWPMAVIRGDMHRIRIGHRTNIQDGSVLHITHASDKTHPNGYPLLIGSDITIGHSVTLHGCTIEDGCLIGMNSVIMDGTFIESGVIVGAKSLVPPGKRLKSGYLYVGSPVVQKRPLTEEERAFIPYSVQNYVKLKDSYLQEASAS